MAMIFNSRFCADQPEGETQTRNREDQFHRLQLNQDWQDWTILDCVGPIARTVRGAVNVGIKREKLSGMPPPAFVTSTLLTVFRYKKYEIDRNASCT